MVSFSTTKPNALLAAIKAAIKLGNITTWSCYSDGDFTHNPPQWKGLAYMRPSVVAGSELRFAIVCPSGKNVSTEVYAIYHGRFTEMMLAHFDREFSTAASTAMASTGDILRVA